MFHFKLQSVTSYNIFCKVINIKENNEKIRTKLSRLAAIHFCDNKKISRYTEFQHKLEQIKSIRKYTPNCSSNAKIGPPVIYHNVM
jgi:hypothetical protein